VKQKLEVIVVAESSRSVF